MKPVNIAIGLLLCFLYVCGLMLYHNHRDITDRRLSRYVKREGLVASLGDHNESIANILGACQANAELLQTLRVEKEPERKFEPWRLVARTARYFNSRLSKKKSEVLAKVIVKKAEKYNLDPLLMTSLISQESAFRSRAKSPVGAYGYGQLMPETAKFLGVNRRDPEQNLEGCAKYLSMQMKRWRRNSNQAELALASYNAGPNAVAYYKGIPPYRETRNYVNIVMARYQTLKDAAAEYQN